MDMYNENTKIETEKPTSFHEDTRKDIPEKKRETKQNKAN
jgi:hypothetical protein